MSCDDGALKMLVEEPDRGEEHEAPAVHARHELAQLAADGSRSAPRAPCTAWSP